MKGAKLPVTITGLLLEGCRFDGASLRDNAADSATISPLPSVTIAWVPQDSAVIYESRNTVWLPVYMDLRRNNMLMKLALPSGGEVSHWLQAGVAIFLNG
ncbi:unnamed protein product [Notodromas monacha]|uniref:Dynein heavy chain C-terminal domain-containing protein n=1 Tax=Notodromas monacha TaxID=399045 RepID=A0A7R9GH08_9CRUS|nr:unnamed protein product [Notodromas monacha]CAG0922264.1 unnamed protein product [Notodromas monacha]